VLWFHRMGWSCTALRNLKPGTSYRTEAVALRSRNRLVVFTDGVIDENDRGEEFGESRLIAIINGALRLPPRRLLSRS
jgi:serine phosphatase RsbU (regulator of sigma subunit)